MSLLPGPKLFGRRGIGWRAGRRLPSEYWHSPGTKGDQADEFHLRPSQGRRNLEGVLEPRGGREGAEELVRTREQGLHGGGHERQPRYRLHTGSVFVRVFEEIPLPGVQTCRC